MDSLARLGQVLIGICSWGLGRTDVPRLKSVRGIPEWASVVEEVLDQLDIGQCSVMAHSAGAPYAMAFANRYPERIRGELCLLAPWVAGGEGGESSCSYARVHTSHMFLPVRRELQMAEVHSEWFAQNRSGR